MTGQWLIRRWQGACGAPGWYIRAPRTSPAMACRFGVALTPAERVHRRGLAGAGSARPVVCLAETSRQLPAPGLRCPRRPVGPPGTTRRTTGGAVNRFLAIEPLGGRRTRLGLARFVGDLLDVPGPDAGRVVPVLDRLGAHPPAPLAAVFSPGGPSG